MEVPADLPMPPLDILKTGEPETKAQHVEIVDASVPLDPQPHVAHLPQGIHAIEPEQNEQWFIGSIDQGTTSSRFLIFNGEGEPVASHQIEFENMYPESG
jgi:glycerol kinase